MAVVEEILRSEADGSISFGNHKLAKKAKVEDYEHAGDLLKVKTYNEMTKLEKNGMFLYESVPGTSVLEFKESDNSVVIPLHEVPAPSDRRHIYYTEQQQYPLPHLQWRSIR